MANHPLVNNKDAVAFRLIMNYFLISRVEWWDIERERWEEVTIGDILVDSDIEVSYNNTWCEPYEGMED